MSYSLDKFLRPLKDDDKVVRIFDDRNYPVHTINPFSVLRLFVTNTNLNIALTTNRTVVLDFGGIEETKDALVKLQFYIDELRKKTPQVINKETQNYIGSVISKSGLNALNGLTSSSQSLSVTSDQNVVIGLQSLGSTHSISLSWTGLLPVDRGGLNNSQFTKDELLISGTNSVISSGYKIDDTGTASTDIWSASKIIDYYNNNIISRETPSGLVDGVNRDFTLLNDHVKDSEHIYLNGLLQDYGDDYTISGNIITFDLAPLPGSKIRCSYISIPVFQ